MMTVEDLKEENVEEFAHTKKKIVDFIQNLLLNNRHFTGKLEINFRNGVLMDINKTERTSF